LGAASLQMGYLKKLGDGSLLYSVVNAPEPDADGGCSVRGLNACTLSSELCTCSEMQSMYHTVTSPLLVMRLQSSCLASMCTVEPVLCKELGCHQAFIGFLSMVIHS
jgi:hypothetical protein